MLELRNSRRISKASDANKLQNIQPKEITYWKLGLCPYLTSANRRYCHLIGHKWLKHHPERMSSNQCYREIRWLLYFGCCRLSNLFPVNAMFYRSPPPHAHYDRWHAISDHGRSEKKLVVFICAKCDGGLAQYPAGQPNWCAEWRRTLWNFLNLCVILNLTINSVSSKKGSKERSNRCGVSQLIFFASVDHLAGDKSLAFMFYRECSLN